ncbi:MAG: WD40 repeat domain-containing protein, partial [Gemmatimonadaceae bacterium]|nr:WD40 repeat domain-containing protein [Acetobacteraceae bacterium]
MSDTIDRQFLLDSRGSSRDLDAYVVGVAFDRTGAAAFALGDGTVHLPPDRGPGDWL